MDVYIDSNEAQWRKDALVRIIDGINAEATFEGEGMRYKPIIKDLEFGDFVAGDLALEFKEPGDFISSLFEKRLFDQAAGLRMNFAQPRIVINCAYLDLFEAEIIRGWHPNAIAAVIPSLIFNHKVEVDFTGERGRDSWTKYMTAYLSKALNGKTIIPHIPVRPSSAPKDHILAMLTCLPGIGEKKAQQILSKYGSLKDFVDNPARMLTVKGWGNTTVRKIEAVINNKENECWGAKETVTESTAPPAPEVKGIPIGKMTEVWDEKAMTAQTAKWSKPLTPEEMRKEMMRY